MLRSNLAEKLDEDRLIDTSDYIVETVPVEVDVSQYKSALRNDEETFINFLMGDKLTYSVPEFHKTIFRMFVSLTAKKIALAVPRGHAKTTLAKLAIVWFFLFERNIRFVVYVSNTSSVAINACIDIINFLESANVKSLFGEIEWLTRREGNEGFFKFKLNGKLCILRALGAGQQVRGLNIDNQRPQVAVVDDLEDNDNIATPALLKKLKRWVFGPFLKALDTRSSKVIWIGNMLKANCILHNLCSSKYWHSMLFGCILEDGEPLWSDMWSIEAIREDFDEYKKEGMLAEWFAEMMNTPIPGEVGLIKVENIPYAIPRLPEDCEMTFITIDPAISVRTSADKTAIVVHGFVDRKWQIVEYVHERLSVNDTIIHAFSLARKWNSGLIAVEAIAYQRALAEVFELMKTIHNMSEIHIVPLRSGTITTKTEHLKRYCALLENDMCCLTEGDIETTEQLLYFDPTKRDNVDDLIDAAALCVDIITYHLGLLMQYYPAYGNIRVLREHEVITA